MKSILFIVLSIYTSAFADDFAKTPLMEAAFEAAWLESPQSLAALEHLLQQKGAIQQRNPKGMTALFYAVNESRKGQYKAVEMLLKAGANPNDAAKMGKDIYLYPLTNAVRLNNPTVVKLLLQYKANPNDKEGPKAGHSSALDLAKQQKLVEIEQILRKAGAKD